jgi:hypothetical protein
MAFTEHIQRAFTQDGNVKPMERVSSSTEAHDGASSDETALID